MLRSSSIRVWRSLAVGAGACCLLVAAAPASAQSGGYTPPTTEPAQPNPSIRTVPGYRAKLNKKGKAIPPAMAPANVQNAIVAVNRLRKRPYKYGGGHQSFHSWGYDCSGTVSYFLYAAGLLDAPMPSGPFMTWGEPGHGRWITTFANRGHMYAVVAGLRLDTSAAGDRKFRQKGPRWRKKKRKPKGFAIRHYPGY